MDERQPQPHSSPSYRDDGRMTYTATAGRIDIQSYTRPLRFAVVLQPPVSPQAFRRSIAILCEMWGGTQSIIVAGTRSEPISPEWRAAVVGLDPDVILLGRGLTSKVVRHALYRLLDDLNVSPFTVEELTERQAGSRVWQPMPVPPPPASDDRGIGRAAPLIPMRPAHIAVLGNAEENPPATARRASASTLPMSTLPVGTPVYRAAQHIPGFATSSSIFSPFLYHRREDVDIGMALWNYRATRGPLLHGADDRLKRHLALVSRSRARVFVVELDQLSPAAARAVSDLGSRAVTVARKNFLFERGRLRLPVGFDRELDTADVREGVFELPARPPAIPATLSRPGGRIEAGFYAVELEIGLQDGLDRRVSLPPRLRSAQLLLADESPAGRLRPTAVRWTRVRRTGDSVLAVGPSRGRVMPLQMPSMREVLQRLAPDVEFKLGDKGRYGRWVARHGNGLAELQVLLTESRSQTIIAALRPAAGSRHSARQFMTLSQLQAALRTARSAGQLGKNRRQHKADGVWIEQWVDARVADGLLRSGIHVRCDECLAQSFMDFDTFGSTFQCPRCGRGAAIPARPNLGFQLAEVAHLFFDNDCDITALALATLTRRARLGYSYDFDHHVKWPKEAAPREIDFAGVLDGEVFIGESKRNGKFEQSDFDLLGRLARAVRATWVVLATGTECERGCSPGCARSRDDPPEAGDTALGRGTGTPGVRDRVEELRRRLAPRGCRTIVLCHGDLNGPRVTPTTWRLARLFAS